MIVVFRLKAIKIRLKGEMKMEKRIFVGGMNCLHCAEYVSEALKSIGAKDVDVSFIKSLATVEISDETTDELIKMAIEEAGYEVVGIQ